MSAAPDDRPRLLDEGDRKSVALAGFRLDFAWSGDRWAHALRVRCADGWSLLASTVEGGIHGDDPARVVSPAYQQFHWQEEDGGLAMLLGQSGPHHFSAVVAVRREGDRVVIAVDLADRCRAAVEALACTYTVEAPPALLLEAGPDRAAWGQDGGAGLTFEAVAPSRVALAEAGRSRTRVQAAAAIDPQSRTHRCLYRWSYPLPGDLA